MTIFRTCFRSPRFSRFVIKRNTRIAKLPRCKHFAQYLLYWPRVVHVLYTVKLTAITCQRATLTRGRSVVGIQNVYLIDIAYSTYFAGEFHSFVIHTSGVQDKIILFFLAPRGFFFSIKWHACLCAPNVIEKRKKLKTNNVIFKKNWKFSIMFV